MMDIVMPKEPLPEILEMGIFTGSVYHTEQKQPRPETERGNCKEIGHMRKNLSTIC